MKKKQQTEQDDINSQLGIWCLMFIALTLMQPPVQQKVVNVYMDGDK